MHVIAMAYGGEPLDRIVTGTHGNVVYVLNPSVASAKDVTPLSGVGFPQWAVFRHDGNLLDSLSAAWSAGDAVNLKRLWAKATPYDIVTA